MANNRGFKTIKDQIVTTLQGVSSLNSVYGKEEKILAGFPAACVSGSNFQSAFQTIASSQGSNKETYQHFIRVYFRTDEANDPDYEDVLESVADDVISAFRSNVKLNGACDWCIPASGTWGKAEKESPLRMFELVLSSTVFNTR